ncbi:TniQ family protein [Pseudomonas moraviensis]|uniref:TniQ family protein n=1 Tax=Pseudomonas moraviensis TaxID=321662 RepID=UPI0009FB0E12|nr:TniQ family protein [Pseudomonas moraviensis]
MDASYQCRWGPGASPVNAVWPLVPPLLRNEVISSWLMRCALAQGCDATTLTSEVWPRLRFWCSDPDRQLPLEQAHRLSRLSGVPPAALQAATLQPLYQTMTGTPSFPKGVAPWFLCLGCRNRRRCGGLQYCPECFKEHVPYYSIQDRLAWHSTCPMHQVILLDRCECCQAPLCPQLLTPPEETLDKCHRCGYQLSFAVTVAGPVNALHFQRATDELFSRPTMSYGSHYLPLAEWLALSRWMIGILRTAARASSPCTETFFRELGVDLGKLTPPSTGLPLEYLSAVDRAGLLADVWSMLQIGHERLIEVAEREHIRPSLLLPRSGKLPPSIAGLAAVLKSRRCGNNSVPPIDNPRSVKSVLMRWQRLLRKFQR